jgi:extradiol dioxygenase family protein
MFDAETAEQMKRMVRSGAFGIGVFETDDIHGDHERLSKQGVEFVSQPEERFYGTEAIVKDNSGNWFSLTQPKR